MARVIDNKYIFIHAAKTGGTFFRECLNRFGIPNWEVGIKHASIKDTPAMPLIPIVIVRHPISWYRSRWRYGMMTYFGEKIKYMPEAKEHWMARVWSNSYESFVRRTLDEYPQGIASEYFNKMVGGMYPLNTWKYEQLNDHILKFLRFQMKLDIGLEAIEEMPRTLQSAKVFAEDLPDYLLQQIVDTEKELVQRFYSN